MDNEKELLKAVSEKLKDKILFPEQLKNLKSTKFVFKMDLGEELTTYKRYIKERWQSIAFDNWLKEEK